MNSSGSYFGNIYSAFTSLGKGLRLTLSHLVNSGKSHEASGRLNIRSSDYFKKQNGIATVQFPHEQLPVPVAGRYQLHNEMDDCIVCDKCVKVCPVNCITIEPIRSAEEFGKTSDGTPRRIYAATFDLDMGKCCFCGLCTTVCPTESLTMTPVFDFSSYDMSKHYFAFGNMTDEEIARKKIEWTKFQEEKQATPASASKTDAPSSSKPAFKPKISIPKKPSAE